MSEFDPRSPAAAINASDLVVYCESAPVRGSQGKMTSDAGTSPQSEKTSQHEDEWWREPYTGRSTSVYVSCISVFVDDSRAQDADEPEIAILSSRTVPCQLTGISPMLTVHWIARIYEGFLPVSHRRVHDILWIVDVGKAESVAYFMRNSNRLRKC